MNRLLRTQWFQPLSFALGTIAGVWMILDGNGRAQVIGLAAILMFGVGGSAVLAIRHADQRAAVEPQVRDVELPDGAKWRALVIEQPRTSTWLAVVGTIAFAIAAVVIAFAPEASRPGRDSTLTRVVLAVSALFLVAMLTIRFGLPKARSISFALTPPGLLIKSVGATTYVPWNSIDSVHRADSRGVPRLALAIREPDQVVRTGYRAIHRLNRVVSPSGIVLVGLYGMGIPAERIVDLVSTYMEQGRASS